MSSVRQTPTQRRNSFRAGMLICALLIALSIVIGTCVYQGGRTPESVFNDDEHPVTSLHIASLTGCRNWRSVCPVRDQLIQL
jgi:hypothetical protein